MFKNKIFCLLALFVVGNYSVNAQSLRRVANNNYYEGNYIFAIDLIRELLKKNPTDNDLKLKLADCYQKLDLNVEAELLYDELIKLPKLTPYHVLNYAKVLAKNENYKKSAEIYTQFTSLNPTDSRGPAFTEAYNNIQRFYQDKERTFLFYTSINSNQSDFAPTYFNNGLVFLSARNAGGVLKKVYSRDNTSFLDFYIVSDTAKIAVQPLKPDGSIKTETNKHKDKLSDDNTAYSANDNATTANFGSTFLNNLSEIPVIENTPAAGFSQVLNSPLHEGPLCFNTTFDTVYFTRNATLPKSGKGKKRLARLYIYTSVLKNGKWEEVTPFIYNNPDFAMGHPTLSKDGKRLYFVSDMPGGYGGTDIYFCRKQGAQWLKPENAGAKINTEGNELFPFIDASNHLFFCTDGKPGLGGQDIFVYWLNDTLRPATNIGAPLNTSFDDFALIYDDANHTGYFSSNRKRGSNDDDIFKFTTTPYSNAIVNVKFENRDKNNTLDNITLSCLNERQLSSFKKNSNTSYTFHVKPNTYVFLAYKDIADTVKFNMYVGTSSKDPFKTTVIDTTIYIDFANENVVDESKNNTLKLLPILYEDDNTFIKKVQNSSLPIAVTYLNEHPTAKLMVRSYGNPTTDIAISKKVALNRATAIKNYITKFGIEPRRLVLEWYGVDMTKENLQELVQQKSQQSDLQIVE